MPNALLIKEWEFARDNLGLTIVAPFGLRISESKTIRADILVKNFGDMNGMLILTNYDIVKPYLKEICALGYGFSVLSEPSNIESYSLEVFVEMLNEWGWTGSDSEKPKWITG